MTFNITLAAQHAQKAARAIAKLGMAEKNAILHAVAEQLSVQQNQILAANQKDILAAQDNGLTSAMVDRLKLDAQRLTAIADAVVEIASQPDPVGSIANVQIRPNGLQVGKMRIPLGVIAMIYESRPNVTIDAAALCLKAGNGVILRGGKEAIHSNIALANCLYVALEQHGISKNAICVVPDTDRSVMNELMTLNQYVDLIIPRGGESLIRFVTENSQIPVIQHFKGVCHMYVDAYADLNKALDLLVNGKTQRTSACNSLETILVHKDIAEQYLPRAAKALAEHNTVIHACENSISYFEGATRANESDWHAEYLAMEVAIRVVECFEDAIDHIEQYSSDHTEVIVTQDVSLSQRFVREINSAVVMVNASSRFSDGGELGLGAEIGISTSKLHAYGPMGVDSLTTEKFVVLGDGQTRD
jgi:glutamate-5-semialdehyde dehydrogenase